MNKIEELKKYKKYNDYMEEYKKAKNASTGSKYDANANVGCKNITTMTGELFNGDSINLCRYRMVERLTKMYGEETASQYLEKLDKHLIYKHDETKGNYPYCASITMYPFLLDGLIPLGGNSTAPTNLESFCGSYINLVYAVSSQLAGAISTPEFFTYMDYFIRKDYGNDYYLKPNQIVALGKVPKTMQKLIEDRFQQIVYSVNMPASARNYQSIFLNVAYFDEPYFKGIFDNFVFPNGTMPQWVSVSWLQKLFMKWFNKERLKTELTFPVETMNLLNDGNDFVDKEWADFTAEMYAEGHSFFTYTSDSVDSLASCCFDGDQKILVKNAEGVLYTTFKKLDEMPLDEKINLKVYHKGEWVEGKLVKAPKRTMYKITTEDNKVICVTDNHINVTKNGDKKTDELTVLDELSINSIPLRASSECDKKLTYNQGFLIGAYLANGDKINYDTLINFRLHKNKHAECHSYICRALRELDKNAELNFVVEFGGVYVYSVSSVEVYRFIEEYVEFDGVYQQYLKLNCLLQTDDFRKGILMGYVRSSGLDSNSLYTTNYEQVSIMEMLVSSLGYNSTIKISDVKNMPCIISKNGSIETYLLYCLQWSNVEMFSKIKSIERYETKYNEVYCFEILNGEPYFTLPNGIITHNCRLRNELQDNTFSFTLGAGGVCTGSKSVITINLNRLIQDGYKTAKENGTEFNVSEIVRKEVVEVHKYLLAYNELLKDLQDSNLITIYDAGFILPEKQYLTVGVNGMVESAEFLGIDISNNDEYFNYIASVLQPIYEEDKKAKSGNIMFNCEFVPAENLGVKFANWDKKDGYIVPRDCYNSYFYRVEDDSTNIIDKLIMHGRKTTKYLDGGSACHINLDEHLDKQQYNNLLKAMIKTGCSYMTINVPNTICNDCDFITKHKFTKCPRCGSDNIDYLTRIIGYLKRVSKFSEARQQEERRRYYAKPNTFKI